MVNQNDNFPLKEYAEAEKDRRLKELETIVLLEGVQKELIKQVGVVDKVIQTLMVSGVTA